MTAKITASADGTYGSLGVGANEAFRFGADTSGVKMFYGSDYGHYATLRAVISPNTAAAATVKFEFATK